MTFSEWLSMRQDARQWSEDELACAELAWNAAVAIAEKRWDLCNATNKNRIAQLERDISWLEHENWNLKNMKEPQ